MTATEQATNVISPESDSPLWSSGNGYFAVIGSFLITWFIINKLANIIGLYRLLK